VSATGEQLRSHLEHPQGRGHCPEDAFTGAAGGAACGDLIRVSLALDAEDPDGRICGAGFDASGCGAVIAAGSAVVHLVREAPLLDAARLGPSQIARELGGLGPAKRHAAELAADALHRALGAGARHGATLASCAQRTLIAMSGGVDSAVAALLVTRAGEEAVGVTLELWSDVENDGDLSCCSAEAVRGARALAHELGMAHLSIDLRAEFRAGVVEGWLAEHAAGLTPNPCVRCNGHVRLDAMLELARRLGARALATGHYARILDGPLASAGGHTEPEVHASESRALLMSATDDRKDQSYVLAALAPESLARLRFPLGSMHKQAVRELAAEAGLAVARRRESQDLCFLAGTGHGEFLARHGALGNRPGAIVDRDGGALGEHPGAHRYTVGQRHGLGLSAPEPLYVLATDTSANTVTVGPRAALLAREVRIREATLHRDGRWVDNVRVRAHGRRFACRLPGEVGAGRHGRLAIELEEPAERTAPGQLACLYAGEVVVGHGTVA
jgi:tRNA-uridine 2-sulfurtransferase